jgi:hypothetical protein
MKTNSPNKIRGIKIWIPGRGVLKAIPVFLIGIIFTHSPRIEILGL